MQIIADKTIRLDKYLTFFLQNSRNQIESLIKNSLVSINNKSITKTGYKLKIGDIIDITLPTIENKNKNNYKFEKEIEIIFEDDEILILNKPPFLVIHDAPSVKEPTLVDYLKSKNIALSTLAGEIRHGIVHRLDKETSGAMVVAKTNNAHLLLSSQLSDKSMTRIYLAIIDNPLKEEIIIEKPIGRNPKQRTKMAILKDGRTAKSKFIPLCNSKDNKKQLIACKLYTGRTHQIRVHLNSINRHILGDKTYGYKLDDIKRVFLHSYFISLKHPLTNDTIAYTAKMFSDMEEYLEKHFKITDMHRIFIKNML